MENVLSLVSYIYLFRVTTTLNSMNYRLILGMQVCWKERRVGMPGIWPKLPLLELGQKPLSCLWDSLNHMMASQKQEQPKVIHMLNMCNALFPQQDVTFFH